MTIASIRKLRMEFAGNLIFDDVSFEVNDNDKVGLIGANGTGKTTVFKLITGELEPVGGDIIISKNTKIGYSEQHACADSVRTVYDEALVAFADLIDAEIELEKISRILENENNELLINRQNDLREEFIANGGLTYKSRTASALKGLGFSEEEFGITCDKLSGGQRSKLSLCKLLLSKADLILLDEPTNHLDISGTEWLESFLQAYKGSVIVISHDRYFLDKICNKTVEISNKRSYSSNGNYSVYLKLKKERLDSERKHYQNQLEEIKRIEGIIEQQRAFGRERNFITAESKRKMLEKKKAELIVPEPDPSEMRIKFSSDIETGNDVLFIDSLSKSFGDRKLFENGSLQVYKNDRAFIIGPNGCGKTTLLRILTRQISADSGRYSFGSNVRTGYFDQSLENLNKGKTVIDEIWDEHRSFTETKVRNYLALFLFRGDDVYKAVDTLSGGEKAKLCLLKLMLSGANVLLLDEPTNHLDITSREVLETALSDFEGTIIAVSHDRYFINKLANKIFRIGPGGFEKFDGGYDDYCSVILTENNTKTDSKPQKINSYKLRKEKESEINRLRGKIKRAEAEIDRLDSEISKLNSEMSDPEVSADYEKVIELTNRINQLTDEQSIFMDEWENNNIRLTELTEEN